MKKSKIKIFVFFLILMSFVFGNEFLNAQSPPPPPVYTVNDAPIVAPINGLIGLVLLAGAIFGIRKIRKIKS